MDLWKDKSLPKVSILIPTYNRPEYLKLALHSALSQTYPNIEIIIGDDSTNDETENMLRPYLKQYDHIKYFRRTAGVPYDNMAECFQLASGEFINFLMDDDIFHTEKITKMMDYFLKYPNVSLVTSYRELIDANGNALPTEGFSRQLFSHDTIANGKDFGAFFMKHRVNFIGEPTTALFRKSALSQGWANYQGIRYFALVDISSWLTLLSNGDFIYIAEPLSFFRRHADQGNNHEAWKEGTYYEWGILIHENQFIDQAERDSQIDGYIKEHGKQRLLGISECTNPYLSEDVRIRHMEIFQNLLN
ncbi:glycosyltransferase family 2 protein [Thermoactinomyces sp. DSM 45892]|uniref:glycosyltransferase family 2 protein n=1 Tax=Thermoactinomyces sp. DSM 45892 TaxID=1882753 RepID=UPI0015A20E88|nr:glycosyltransferase family 2 protein [Thermoactinomyces sp. DSM 45892]